MLKHALVQTISSNELDSLQVVVRYASDIEVRRQRDAVNDFSGIPANRRERQRIDRQYHLCSCPHQPYRVPHAATPNLNLFIITERNHAQIYPCLNSFVTESGASTNPFRTVCHWPLHRVVPAFSYVQTVMTPLTLNTQSKSPSNIPRMK